MLSLPSLVPGNVCSDRTVPTGGAGFPGEVGTAAEKPKTQTQPEDIPVALVALMALVTLVTLVVLAQLVA